MSVYDDSYNETLNGILNSGNTDDNSSDSSSDNQEQPTVGGFISNLGNNIIDSVTQYAENAVQRLRDMTTPPTEEQLNSAQGMNDYSQQQQEAVTNFQQTVIKPPLGAAAFVFKPAALAYLPFMGKDFVDSVKEKGVAETLRDFTYGQAVDYWTQPDLKQKLYEKPFTTTAEGILSTLPPVLMAKGGYRAIVNRKANVDNVTADSPEVADVVNGIENSLGKEPDIPTADEVNKSIFGDNANTASSVPEYSNEDANLVVKTAEENNSDPKLALAIAARETGGDNVNAIGNMDPNNLMQITKESADYYGINDKYPDWETDHKQNIEAGLYILSKKIEENNGDVWAGVKAYNGSGSAADEYVAQVQRNYNSIGQNELPPLDQKYYTSVESENPDIADMSPSTENKMNYLAKAYEDKYGESLQITSGKREGDASASDHNTGHAFDVGNERLVNDADARHWLLDEGKKLGLVPLDEVESPSAGATGPHIHFSDKGNTARGFSSSSSSESAAEAGNAARYASDAERQAEESRQESQSSLNDTEKTANQAWKETSEEYLKRVSQEQEDRANAEESIDTAAKTSVKTDEYNVPIEFYHGTRSDFSNFDTEKTGGLINFTTNKNVAESYAIGESGGRLNIPDKDKVIVDHDGNAYEKNKNGDWIATGYMPDNNYANIQKGETVSGVKIGEKIPSHELSAIGSIDSDFFALPKKIFIKKVNLKIKNPLNLINNPDASLDVFKKIKNNLNNKGIKNKTLNNAIKSLEQNKGNNFWTTTKYENLYKEYKNVIVPELKKMGYDGIIFNDDRHPTYAVFDTNQIINDILNKKQKINIKIKTDDEILDDHKNAVEEALQQGKDVPDKVLSEYPDLEMKYSESNHPYKPLQEGQYGSVSNPDVVPAKPKIQQNVTAPEIRAKINKLLQTYIGSPGSSKFIGMYDPSDNYIRIRSYGDFDTYAHEIGHAIDHVFNIQGHDNELINNAAKVWGENKVFQDYPNKTKRAEGIAEFGRQYMLNPYYAEMNFPGYYKSFMEKMNSNPDFAKKIDDIGNLMKNWFTQSPEARARGMTSFGNELPDKNIKEKFNSIIENARTAWVDKLRGLEKITAQTEAAIGRKLSFEENPYKQARMASTSPIGCAEMFMGYDIKDVGKAFDVLNEIYNGKLKYKVTMTDIFKTIRDDEMNKKYPTYLSDNNYRNWQEALGTYLGTRRAVELHETQYETPLKNAKDRLKSANDSFNKVNADYQNILHDKDKAPNGKSARYLRDKVISAKVELRNAQSEVNHLSRNGYKTHVSMEDAKTVIDNAPKELKDAAEKIYQYQDNLISIQQDAGLISGKLAEALRGKYKYYVPMARDFSEEGGVGEFFSGRGKDIINVHAVLKRLSGEGSTRIVKNPLEQIIQNTYAVLDAAERNKVGQTLIKLSRFPEMGKFLVNAPEGVADAKKSIFTVMFDGEKKAFQTTPEIYEAIKNLQQPSFGLFTKTFGIFTKALRIGATGVNPSFIIANVLRDGVTAAVYDHSMIPLISTIKGVNTLLRDDKTALEFKASGAPMAALVGMDRPGIQRQIQILSQDGTIKNAPKTEQAKFIAQNMYEAFRNVSETAENATRISAFKNARNKGQSIAEAGLAAKESTVDFSRSGTYGQKYNQFTAFFNAAVQGTSRMIRAFEDNPTGTSAGVAKWIILPTIALYALNYNQDWYQNLPSYQKDNNWIFSPDGGDHIFMVPKPQEVGILFGSSIERALDQYMDIDPKGVSRWLDDARNTLQPNIVPTAIQPMVEWVTNYNMYTNKPIVNERDQQHTPPEQYDVYTSELAKTLGWYSGTSPKKIDHAIQGYLGGAGKFMSQVSNYVMGDHTVMPDKGISDIPGINRFAESGGWTQPQAVSDFYDTYTRMHQEYSDSGAKHPTTDISRINAFHKQITDLNKKNRAILEGDLSADEKAMQMQQINEKIKQIAEKANKQYPPQ